MLGSINFYGIVLIHDFTLEQIKYVVSTILTEILMSQYQLLISKKNYFEEKTKIAWVLLGPLRTFNRRSPL